MISPASWWWPNRPPRVPRAWTAGLLAGLGVVLFGTSALLVKAGTTSGDARLFRILNQVPPGVASVLTPLSHLFLPAGIIAIVVLTVVYAVARNRSVLPVAAAAVAAGAAWVLAHVAKAIADRPRPYVVMSDAVLRQQPPHGTSFPSSHTAVTVAVVIALVPFLVRPLAAELAPIRVTGISPGFVDTPWWSGMPEDMRRAYFAQAAQALPARRIATADDVAAATWLPSSM